MPKKGHIPERTCVICKKKEIKDKLIRFVAKNQEVLLDEMGILPGRGAYLCMECFPKLKESLKFQKKLRRALRLEG